MRETAEAGRYKPLRATLRWLAGRPWRAALVIFFHLVALDPGLLPGY